MIRFVQQIITALFFRGKEKDHLSRFVIIASAKLFLLHGFSLLFGFLLNYILVKTIDVKEYGAYVYIFNLINLLAGFCLLGIDTLLVKKVSVYDTLSKYAELKGIIIFSIGAILLGSIIVALLSTQVAGLVNIQSEISSNWLVLTFLSFCLLSLTGVSQASLQGLKKITLSQAPEKIVKPLVIILSVLIFYYSRKTIMLDELIWINISAIGLACLLTAFFLIKNLFSKISNVKPLYDGRAWTNSALSFFVMSILYLLNSKTDIFLLGILKGSNKVGVYNIVLRISEFLSFGLMIINFVLAPLIANLFANKEISALQKLIVSSARIVLLFTLPLVIAVAFFRREILLFFGVGFLDGENALLILCAGQLINVLFGSVGLLLTMTGNQRFSIISLAAGTIFSIVLNITLTPVYDIEGTAIATSGGLIIWNGMMYFFVRKKMKIHTTALGII